MMTTPVFRNFDLMVEPVDGTGYRARVLESPVGEVRPLPVTLPFSDLEIENLLLRVGRPRQRVRGVESTEDAASIREFGSRLFDAVFHDDLHEALISSIEQVESQTDTGLRLRLRLTDCPELADLPWEYLYDKQARRFLALSQWTPVVRYLDLPGRIRPLPVQPPLRILMMAASPSDFPPLNIGAEWTRVQASLAELQEAGRVQLHRVRSGTLPDLRRELRRGTYHVFHYVGHGRYNVEAGDGELALEGPDGRAQLVRGADVGALLHDHRSLRLAVLNSCEGARGGRADPYSGTAQSLVQQGIPAVVAMQFEITDPAAIAFAQSLYEAVADGFPLDAALAEARNAIREQPNPVEWATPVLYLRSPDGRIFDVEVAGGAESDSARTQRSPSRSGVAALQESGGVTQPGEVTRVPQPIKADRTGQVDLSVPFRRTWPGPAVIRLEVQHPRGGVMGLGIRDITDVTISPDRSWLATASDDQTARVWEMNGRQLLRLKHGLTAGYVVGVAFSPRGRKLATSTTDSGLRVWQLPAGTVIDRFSNAPASNGAAMRFSSDERHLAVGAGIWELSSARMVTQLDHGSRVMAVAFDPGTGHLATAGDDGSARIWDIHDGTLVTRIQHAGAAQAVEFSPDGGYLASGSSDGIARVSDPSDGRPLVEVRHEGAVEVIAFDADAAHFATAGDGAVRVWELSTGSPIGQGAYEGVVRALAFGDEALLVATAQGLSASLWELRAVDHSP